MTNKDPEEIHSPSSTENREETTESFLEKLASKAPIPGGGGASAYAGAMGMALGLMVGNLTLGKKKYQRVEKDIQELQEKARIIAAQLKGLVEKDAQAFYPLSQAYRLPQETALQKEEKETAIQQALKPATLVPFEIARYSLQAIQLQEQYGQMGSAIAISDVGVGTALLMAALEGAKLNVLINTKLMKDPTLKTSLEKEIRSMAARGRQKGEAILKAVEARLAEG